MEIEPCDRTDLPTTNSAHEGSFHWSKHAVAGLWLRQNIVFENVTDSSKTNKTLYITGIQANQFLFNLIEDTL